jgi:hypothetical protein
MHHQLPDRIAINHDTHYARYVGHTHDNMQFFLTTPFIPYCDEQHPGNEFIAVFLFDSVGCFVEARIDDLGPRADLDPLHAQRIFDQRLHELGAVVYGRITIQLFQIHHARTTFGLVAHAPESHNDNWWITLEPGNYMAFYAPWNSGIYAT